MTAPPMRPVENAIAILAAFLVAGALLPWEMRLACAVGAGGLMVLLAVLRYRAHTVRVQKRRIVDVYAQVARLRADRKARFDRPARPGRRG